MITKEQTAWAAGLFEGEGFINFRPGNGDKLYVRLGIRMTDRDVLDRFCAIVGVGKIYGPFPATSPADGEAKDYSEWRTFRSEDVRRILETFMSYFGERRAIKAEEAMLLLDDIKGNKPYSSRHGSRQRGAHHSTLKEVV